MFEDNKNNPASEEASGSSSSSSSINRNISNSSLVTLDIVDLGSNKDETDSDDTNKIEVKSRSSSTTSVEDCRTNSSVSQGTDIFNFYCLNILSIFILLSIKKFSLKMIS